ncbi:hypothetical protein C1645_812879 [Glomus cerebriforme]|uniref:Uncharacterized protein n=1 Tax=Glomus cerebriforme TaxID=658196 RepID=A0A397TJC0_9GLOM|nr:hypothetical protein C1645_812879 [Glomus cerebriforme]
MAGKASADVYKPFIELELLLQKYKNKHGDGGKKLETSELSEPQKNLSTSKKQVIFSLFVKILKKNAWRTCNVAPTYREAVNSTTWNNILSDLNLEQNDKKAIQIE